MELSSFDVTIDDPVLATQRKNCLFLSNNQKCKKKHIFAIFGLIRRRQTAYSVNA